MENVTRCTLDAAAPIRRVTYNNCPYFCAVDMAKLFGIKNPSDTMERLVANQTVILIPCKHNKKNSKPLRFLTEIQTREFVENQLRERKLIDDENAEWQVELFIKALKSNRKPSILEPKEFSGKTVLRPLPSERGRAKAERTETEIDTLSVLTLIKMYKSFVNDVRTYVSA